MAEEILQKNIVSESHQSFAEEQMVETTSEGSKIIVYNIPTSTTSGFEDLPQPKIEEDNTTKQDIMDGFEFEKPSPEKLTEEDSTPTVSTTSNGNIEEKGFDEELTTPKEHKKDLESPLALWMVEHKINPTVIQLIYWEKWQRSAGVSAGLLFLLFSLKCYSLVSVITTFAMSVLAVAFLYRIGMTIVNAVQKTSAEHPFKHLLDGKIELSEEMVDKWSSHARNCINKDIKNLQKLFLVEDVAESLKFGVMLWLISYLASWFSLLTVAILLVISVFTLPKLYEEKQTEIDQVFQIARKRACALLTKVEQKLPERLKSYIIKDKKEQ